MGMAALFCRKMMFRIFQQRARFVSTLIATWYEAAHKPPPDQDTRVRREKPPRQFLFDDLVCRFGNETPDEQAAFDDRGFQGARRDGHSLPNFQSLPIRRSDG